MQQWQVSPVPEYIYSNSGQPNQPASDGMHPQYASDMARRQDHFPYPQHPPPHQQQHQGVQHPPMSIAQQPVQSSPGQQPQHPGPPSHHQQQQHHPQHPAHHPHQPPHQQAHAQAHAQSHPQQQPQQQAQANQAHHPPTPQTAAPPAPRGRKRAAPTPTPAAAAPQAPPVTAAPPTSAAPSAAPSTATPATTAPAPLTTPAPPIKEEVTQPAPPPVKKSRTNTPWTPAEEQRLKQMRDAGNSWAEIAKTFPTRTEGSVKKHWYKDMHYAEFAEDESQALMSAIKEYENNKWKVIGQKVGKPAKACEQYAKEHFPDLFGPPKTR